MALRYALVVTLFDHRRPMRVTELIEQLRRDGHEVWGRPSKTVSDSLRWEVRRGRVQRPARGVYAPGVMPRSTEWYIRRRLASMAA
jgi:hypothetical protein